MILTLAFTVYMHTIITGIDMSDEVEFCSKHPHSVACEGHAGRKLSFEEVTKVDHDLRKDFRYHNRLHKSDHARWGNCLDYVLTLSQMLATYGEDGKNMTEVTMVVCDEGGCDAHARLWVDTSDKGRVEVDVSDPPGPIVHNDGIYFGYMKEDGNQVVVPAKGFHLTLGGIEVDQK